MVSDGVETPALVQKQDALSPALASQPPVCQVALSISLALRRKLLGSPSFLFKWT